MTSVVSEAFDQTDIVRDAFRYLGLEYQTFPPNYSGLQESSAAYAGYGRGLCPEPIGKNGCKVPMWSIPSEVILTILYTRTVLSVSLSRFGSVYHVHEPDVKRATDFSLGYKALEPRENSVSCTSVKYDDEAYWQAVRLHIEHSLNLDREAMRPDKVILLGDMVNDDNFRRVLYQALSNQLGESGMSGILDEDPVYIAARGVALMAKRPETDPR